MVMMRFKASTLLQQIMLQVVPTLWDVNLCVYMLFPSFVEVVSKAKTKIPLYPATLPSHGSISHNNMSSDHIEKRI